MQQTTSLRKVEGDIYTRGVRGNHYIRKRIPAALRQAYPPTQSHIQKSLKTSSIVLARRSAPLILAQIDKEFQQRRAHIDLEKVHLSPLRITGMTPRQRQGVLDYWSHQALGADDAQRAGELDDEQFEELQAELLAQRNELGSALARGRVGSVATLLDDFLLTCGLTYDPSDAELRETRAAFLSQVVKVLDYRLQRQRGESVRTDDVAPATLHPLYLIAPDRAPKALQVPTWDRLFEAWRDDVVKRPPATTTSGRTHWKDLQVFCEALGIVSPADVTEQLMNDFAKDMRGRLAVTTARNRMRLVRRVFAIARGNSLVRSNPAEFTRVGLEATAARRRKKRLPFSHEELQAVFGAQVYREHRRSKGQVGEAIFWLPLLMHFTGARPEELAGLALVDLKQGLGDTWYFDILDRFDDDDDDDLFVKDDGTFPEHYVPCTHRRTLKNGASVRKVPVAKELLDLGLLRYVEHVRQTGSTVFFPSLRKDRVGRLSGALVKVFSRIKLRELRISDRRKVLYSLRHNMKDLLEAAKVPSKVLMRILGHATGDGAISDSYGSDLPFEVILEQFAKVKFPVLPATPWQPGRGTLRYPTKSGRRPDRA